MKKEEMEWRGRMSAWREIVVLVLRNVVYESIEIPSLEEFLIQKYGFRKVEEEVVEVSETEEKIPVHRKKILFEEEKLAPMVLEEILRRCSVLEIYEGSFRDAEISVCFLGETSRERDTVEINRGERYYLYIAKYQMVKLISESGYALQRFMEELSVHLGLKIGKKEWVFHRCAEG